MLKKAGLLITIITLFINVSGHNVSREEAGKVARAFMHSRLNLSSQVDISGVNAENILDIASGASQIYAVNFSSGGFVLIAGNTASVPVLGYSFEGTYTGEAMPSNLEAWLEGYKLQINDLAERNIQPTIEILQKWDDLMNYDPEAPTSLHSITQVSPLLTSTWDQGGRYNELCPDDANGPGGHVWSGCVATAMSQIINYWRFPLQGIGSHGYYSDYGYLSVNFGESTYDFNQMNDNIAGESNYEMAEIQYHCGVAVDMMYSPSGSGAYSEDAAAALRNYFGYSPQLNLQSKDDYTDSQWAALLMQNLDDGWPLYYHGFGSGGHAFNLDGYQGSDYFHFNWGWSGSYNGYFYLNNLNPGGNNFNYGQGAIVNFHPGSNYPYFCNGIKTLTLHNGTLEDGSGPVDPYTSGLSCGWLIAPEDSISGLTLIFDKFDVTSGIDALNVYNGPDASYPLMGSFTGSALPPALVASGDKLFIEFMTSGNQGSGWKAHYTSSIVSYCSGLTVLTEPEGTIVDGSAGRMYHNNSICKYKITPEGASSISINFNSLNTEADLDVIKIYDYVSQSLIGTYSGNQLPGEIIVPSSKAYVLFTSNNAIQGEGWELTYTSSTTGISETTLGSGSLKVKSYPNPAKDWLRVELSNIAETTVVLSLVSADGRMVVAPSDYFVTGTRIAMLNTSEIQNGIYFLKYNSPDGSGMRKVIVAR